MWLGLVSRFWKPCVGLLIAVWAVWFLHHRGYESGFAASEAKWHGRFEAAERELAAANARTETKEAESKRASAESQRRIDETQQALRARTADYDGRLRALSVRLAAASARRCEVSTISGSSPPPDGAAEIEQRASAVGSAIATIGADCESDAARLAEWQRFYTEQRAILTDSRSLLP